MKERKEEEGEEGEKGEEGREGEHSMGFHKESLFSFLELEFVE